MIYLLQQVFANFTDIEQVYFKEACGEHSDVKWHRCLYWNALLYLSKMQVMKLNMFTCTPNPHICLRVS